MRAYAHWLRALISRPDSCARTSRAPETPIGVSGSGAARALRSLKADAWVEPTVGEVGEEVEDDDDHRRQHEERHHGIWVAGLEVREEVEAHAVEREDGLGDDRSGEQSPEVERDESDERDERVPEGMLHRDAPLLETLRPRRAHVVRVHDLEHGGAHVA